MSGISDTTASRGPNDDASAPAHLATLAQVQQWRAQAQPDLPAFTFLRDGELDAVTLSYSDLDQRAAWLAGHLVQRGAKGQPVLLVFEPGIDYVVSFFACLYAEAIAVPVYPPDPFNLPRTLPRLQAIVENAGAQWLLTTEDLAEQTRLDQISAELLLIHQLDQDPEPIRRGAEAGANALLQYTSGSTGTPRGVIVNHGNLMHNFQAMHQMFDVENAIVAHWLPPYHDMGLIGCLLLPIYSGRHTVAMSPFAFMQKPIRWLQAIDRYQATTSGAPNFGYELCVRKIKPHQLEGLDLSSWRVAVTGAEPVRAATLDAFSQKFAPIGFRQETFLPAFGMAEATLIVSGEHRQAAPRREDFRLDHLEQRKVAPASDDEPSRRLVGCGKPAKDVRVRIVDPETRLPLGANEIGEIWLQSPGVGAGYWREPDLTRDLFRAAIANESGDERYLRTGDLGFLRDDELFVTGRRKELIILGGRNLYPLDLEQAVQASHPDLKVDGGAAFSIEVDGEERLVVAQEVLRPKRHDLNQLLNSACEALVSEAGVAPHALLLISAGSLPKTSSGKTRRGECRRQYLEGGLRVLAQWPLPDASHELRVTPPSTDTECRVAEIWEEVLGLETVGLEDDFFLLGAKSIRIAAMLGRVSEWLERDVPLKLLFKHSSLQAFSGALDELREDDERVEPFQSLSGDSARDVAPLTDAQQRFWFLEKLQRRAAGADPAGEAQPLHIPLELELQGDVNPNAIHKRLRSIVRRHEILRVSFHEHEGQPQQKLHDEVELAWSVEDLRSPTGGRDAALETWRRTLRDQPMALDQPPLARASLARVDDFRWRLCLILHHLIADGWSMGLLLRELGDADRSPPRAPGYLSYAAWQASRNADHAAESEETSVHQQYWRKRLDHAPTTLEISAGNPQGTGLGRCRVELDDGLLGSIRQHTRQSAATPFMLYMAAFQAVLSRYANAEDLVVGTITANRRRPVCEQMLGCFINTVPMRADLSGDPTLEQFLQRVRRQVIADLDHGSYPFERLIEDLNPPRTAGRLPLVQAMLLLQEGVELPRRVGGAGVTSVEAGQAGLAEFDISLVLEPTAGSVAATLQYHHRTLTAAAAQRLLDSYVATLACFLDSPKQSLSQLPIPAKPERLELLVDRNATDRAHATHDPLEMLEEGAKGRDDEPAIWFDGQSTSYAALHARVNRVARRLQYLGVGPDVPVAIRMPRGPEMVAATLAVLKAGGAFVPLDLSHPLQRQTEILNDCQPRLIIDGSEPSADCSGAPLTAVHITRWDQLLADAQNESPSTPRQNSGEDNLAYIIYTSGTTGAPKGVMVTRGGLGNFLQSFSRTPGMSPSDRVLAHTTVSFDISILEILLPLCVGAEMVLAPCNAGRDPRTLIGLVEQHHVNFIQATPSGFRMWRDAGWRPQPVDDKLTLLVGGEAVSTDLAAFLISDAKADVWNVYGPTETTIWSTISRITSREVERCWQLGASPAIGRPIDNTQVYVLDQHRRPAPIGVVGDLYIGGHGVARGYWNNPTLSRERFLEDDYSDQPGHRLYHTGDRVRWRGDGALEFFGRDDAQAKIRGFRVELGEIEAALLSHTNVREAAVIARRVGDDAELVAYVVWNDVADDESVRSHLATTLPAYMLPSQIIALDALPRSGAGKVDRKQLPEIVGFQPRAQVTQPSTALECAVAAAWADVLGEREFDVHDRFFEIGGHSLKAVRMLSRLETSYAVQLDVPAFFADPTIAGCASQLLVAIAQQENDLERLLAEIEAQDDLGDDPQTHS